MVKIQVIIGSVRQGRVGEKVAEWFMKQLPLKTGYEFELIDLADWDLPLKMEFALPAMGQYGQTITKKWAAKITEADGYIIITPEYNHGYPAGLKNAIDQIYAEWQKKPVVFVGYGVLGAARAIEQLVTVTAQIGMVPLPMASINIIDSRTAFDDKYNIKPDHIKGSVDRLLTQLNWWTAVLKKARLEK